MPCVQQPSLKTSSLNVGKWVIIGDFSSSMIIISQILFSECQEFGTCFVIKNLVTSKIQVKDILYPDISYPDISYPA